MFDTFTKNAHGITQWPTLLWTYFSSDYINCPFLNSVDRLFCTYTVSTQYTLQVAWSLNRCTLEWMNGYSI